MTLCSVVDLDFMKFYTLLESTELRCNTQIIRNMCTETNRCSCMTNRKSYILWQMISTGLIRNMTLFCFRIIRQSLNIRSTTKTDITRKDMIIWYLQNALMVHMEMAVKTTAVPRVVNQTTVT